MNKCAFEQDDAGYVQPTAMLSPDGSRRLTIVPTVHVAKNRFYSDILSLLTQLQCPIVAEGTAKENKSATTPAAQALAALTPLTTSNEVTMLRLTGHTDYAAQSDETTLPEGATVLRPDGSADDAVLELSQAGLDFSNLFEVVEIQQDIRAMLTSIEGSGLFFEELPTEFQEELLELRRQFFEKMRLGIEMQPNQSSLRSLHEKSDRAYLQAALETSTSDSVAILVGLTHAKTLLVMLENEQWRAEKVGGPLQFYTERSPLY